MWDGGLFGAWSRVVTDSGTNRRKGWVRKDPANERGRSVVRYRAYPSDKQRHQARRIDGCCRVVKNLAKEQRDFAWSTSRRRPSYTAQCNDIQELRNDPEVAPWLAEAPVQVLQQAIKDTDFAYRRFLAGGPGYPRWAKKSGWVSFRDPQGVKVERVSRRWGEVNIQGLGRVRVRMHRAPIGSRVCSATYVEEPDGKVFIAVVVERHKRNPTKPRIDDPFYQTAVGIDRGGVVAAATFDGVETDLRNFTPLRPGEAERLRRLERSRERKKLARKAGNAKAKSQGKDTWAHKSNKQADVERRIASLHARKRRRGNDFVEQTSNDLAKNHSLSVFEDLPVKKMTASARGTLAKPGKRVKQKAGMNRSFLSKLPATFETRTTQETLRHGHLSREVPRYATSLTCPVCRNVDPANQASRDLFRCSECGHEAHADANAAIEIRERGIKLVLAGGTPVAASQGTNLGPGSEGSGLGAEPELQGRRGSGKRKKGHITARDAA